jgi:hypothetical protein
VGGFERIPHTNVKFSLIHNDIHSPIFAVGSAVEIPSFIQKQRMRTDNYGFNIEAGFFAAMSALDKRIEFRYIPHYHFNVNDK